MESRHTRESTATRSQPCILNLSVKSPLSHHQQKSQLPTHRTHSAPPRLADQWPERFLYTPITGLLRTCSISSSIVGRRATVAVSVRSPVVSTPSLDDGPAPRLHECVRCAMPGASEASTFMIASKLTRKQIVYASIPIKLWRRPLTPYGLGWQRGQWRGAALQAAGRRRQA